MIKKLWNWLTKKPTEPAQIEVQQLLVDLPKEDEMLIIVLPANTPINVIQDVERAFVEMQNYNRRFLTTTIPLRFTKVQKKAIEKDSIWVEKPNDKQSKSD